MKKAVLTAITLENFKAFGKPARVPLAPITLLFGENSAGKSTILQALYLLKQTRELGSPNVPLLLRAENGYVDMGSFRETIHSHDIDRGHIRLRLDMERLEPEEIPQDGLDQIPDTQEQSIGLDFRFGLNAETDRILVESIALFESNEREPIAQFTAVETLAQAKPAQGTFHYKGTLQCSGLAKEGRHWERHYAWLKENQDWLREFFRQRFDAEHRQVSRALMRHAKHLEEKGELERSDDGGVIIPHTINVGENDAAVDMLCAFAYQNARDFLSRDFSYADFVDEYGQMLRHHAVQPTSYIPRAFDLHGAESFATPAAMFDDFAETIREHPEYRMGPLYFRARLRGVPLSALVLGGWALLIPLPSPVDRLLKSGQALEKVIDAFIPFSPARVRLQRVYTVAGHSPDVVTWSGQNMVNYLFHRRDFLDEVNNWLGKLGVDYEVHIRDLAAEPTPLVELRLRDTRARTKYDVNAVDVGYGVGQMLPFLVQALSGDGSLISVEQPELHIHPRLQSELGSLFAEGISKGNRFIIETHSEHLILRLQKLIRTGKLKPDDVSVLYVARGPEGSTVEQLRLDEEGCFIDEWPGGFFPERLKELL